MAPYKKREVQKHQELCTVLKEQFSILLSLSDFIVSKDEDDAEAILLGCTGFAQFAQELEENLHIPVLDGVVCAVKMAEAIVELGKTTSKYKTYRPPERKAFSGMFEKFGRS